MDYFGIWQWVGIALAAWVLWDLFSGSVYLHRKVYRAQEPSLYWMAVLLWAAVAASCFFGGYYLA